MWCRFQSSYQSWARTVRTTTATARSHAPRGHPPNGHRNRFAERPPWGEMRHGKGWKGQSTGQHAFRQHDPSCALDGSLSSWGSCSRPDCPMYFCAFFWTLLRNPFGNMAFLSCPYSLGTAPALSQLPLKAPPPQARESGTVDIAFPGQRAWQTTCQSNLLSPQQI